MKSKKTILSVAIALLLLCAVGGTLAWLTAQTTEVENTFTASDIGVGLSETTGTSYKMIPGWEITKDPQAWIESGSEDAYLFVKVEKSENFETFMEYAIDTTDWKLVSGQSDVYYREVTGTDITNETKYPILLNNKITVKGEGVTTEMMNELTDATKPTLTFTAYAHQLYQNNTTKFDAATAWANLNK